MKISYLIAAIFAVAAVAWVASGRLGAENDEDTPYTKGPAAIMVDRVLPSVRVRDVEVTESLRRVVLQGRTEADRSIVVRSETSGRVIELLVKRGDTVEAGQLLARLDPQERPATLAEASAHLAQRRVELAASEQLQGRGFRSNTELLAARAQVEAAEARVERAQQDLAKLEVRAPFSGVVEDVMIDLGTLVDFGVDVARLVDLDPMLVAANASEREIGSLKLGQVGEIELGTGQRAEGQIVFIGTTARETTRTFPVEIEVPNSDLAIAEGLSATVAVPVERIRGLQVSPKVLTFNEEGDLGIKVVDADDRVEFHGIDLVRSEQETIWVSGLPERVRLITVGHEFVEPGEQVRVTYERDDGAAATGEQEAKRSQ